MSVKTSLVPVLECSHADTCLPDYWGGHHLAHISIFAHRGMTFKEIKSALHSELNQGAVMGNDARTLDNSGEVGDTWYYRAHAAIERMKPAIKGTRKFFMDLEEDSDEDTDSMCAYFVFVDKE